MISDQEVLEFINRRFPNDNNWTNGNCYWMAIILSERFDFSIYYDYVNGHFFAGYETEMFDPMITTQKISCLICYDWTGRIDEPAKYIKLDTLKIIDPYWYNRLMRDCKC